MNWIKTKQALKLLEENRRPVTKIGLLYIGRRHKIIRKAIDGHHHEYSEDGLKRYLEITSDIIPRGFISVVEANRKYGHSVSKIYRTIRTYDIMWVFCGRKQKMYFSEEDFLSVI